MQDRRKHRRGAPERYIPVVNRTSGKRIGVLANLSAEGAMLITDSPIKSGMILPCRVELPLPILDRDIISFDAECRWCRKNIDEGRWESGYLLTMSAIDRELVAYLSLSFALGECGVADVSEPKVVLQEELRTTTRYGLKEPLPVYERHGYRAIGKLIDLSIQGAGMITRLPVDTGRIISCKVKLPRTIFGREYLFLDAECRWCRRESDGRYESGYLLQNVSETDAAVILHLIIRVMEEKPAKRPVRVSR